MTPDLQLLRQRIERLANYDEPVSDQRRQLKIARDQSAFAAVQREIVETKRARRLVFHNNRGEEISLAVRSGAILRVLPPSAPFFSSLLLERLDTDLDEEDADAVSALLDALTSFTKDVDQVWASSVPITIDGLTAGRGITMAQAQLPEENQESASPFDPHQMLAHFIEGSSDELDAFITLDEGRPVQQVGAKDDVAQLEALAEASVTEEQDAPPNCFILSGQDTKGRAVFFGCAGPLLIFAVFAAAKTAQVLHAWQKSISS